MSTSGIDRRRFLGTTAAATAAFFAMHDSSLLAAQSGAGAAASAGAGANAAADELAGRPRLLALELRTSTPLDAMKTFYGKTLDLGIAEQRADRFTVEAGETRMTFVQTPD